MYFDVKLKTYFFECSASIYTNPDLNKTLACVWVALNFIEYLFSKLENIVKIEAFWCTNVPKYINWHSYNYELNFQY